MATAAQLTANTANAQLSTGPRTPEGKAHSATNATREGFTAQSPVVAPAERQAFDNYKSALAAETQPQGAIELEYFDRLLTYGWNLRRVRAAESALLASTDLADDTQAPRLLRLARYRRDLERSYDRALAELRNLQTHRAILLASDDEALAQTAAAAPLADLDQIPTPPEPVFFNTPVSSLAAFDFSRNEPNSTPGPQNQYNAPSPTSQGETHA